MGSRVNVGEVDGRRVRIDEPIGGWCSIESSNGDLILSPTDQAPLSLHFFLCIWTTNTRM